MERTMIALPHFEPESFDSRCSNKRISPRNSKWLQQNVTDMNAKVKEVVTLIEEDASSFNRKAEMYFRKRPVLMKLIEELYRAYRALAERYDYTNGELEWAHRVMKKACPTKVLFGLIEDSPSSSSTNSQNLQTNRYIEPNDVVRKEKEVRNLEKAFVAMCGEKEEILFKYQNTMEKLLDLEEEFNSTQMSGKPLSEQASEAKTEVQRLKEAIIKVEVERDIAFLNQKELTQRISTLECRISQVQNEELNEGAPRAEIRAKCLENEVSRLETEKETSLSQYKMCLEDIAHLERKISVAENEAGFVYKRAHQAETEEKKLRNDFYRLNKEEKSVAIEYDHCLEKVSNLESELSSAEDEMRRIRSDFVTENENLKSADDRYSALEIYNSSIRSDVMILEFNIAMKEKLLLQKHEELEKLMVCVEEERLRFVKIESATLAFQNLQSQEENGILEIREVVLLLKEFDLSQNGTEKKEVFSSVEDLQSGVLKLNDIKERLEEEVVVQKGVAGTLREHVYILKEDIEDSKERYQALKKKIMSVGLNPEFVGSSLKALKDANSNLRQIYKENKEGKEALSNELDSLEQSSKENVAMGMSFQWLDEDKLALESQLRTICNYMEKNTFLETPLYVANVELDSLEAKSENLKEYFGSLDNKKIDLVSLDNIERRLGSLENKLFEAEKNCKIMESEPTLAQVEDIKVSLGLQKRECLSLETLSEARLTSLEKHLNFLNQEVKWSKIEFEEEVDRAVNSHFEIFILHITIQDLEMKNRSLLMECETHIESSKLRENLVSELERENLEQQVEIELLISEIEKLRADIFRVFKALGYTPGNKLENIIENIEGMKSSLSSYEDDRLKLLVEKSILLELLGQVRVEGTKIMRDKKILNKELENVNEKLMIVQNDKHELIKMNKQLKSEMKKEKQNAETLKDEIEMLCVYQRDMERDYMNLKEEHSQALEENSNLMKSFIDLKNEKRILEEENDCILAEMLVLDNHCTVLKNFVTEKDMKIDLISKDLQNLETVNGYLEKEVDLLNKRMEMEEMGNLSLKDSVKKMEKEIFEVQDMNNQLRIGISEEMKIICLKEMEVCFAEESIKATEDLNSDLCKTLEELKRKLEETEVTKEDVEKENIELSEEHKNRGEEILFLREVNGNLGLEIDEKKNEFQDLNDRFRNKTSTETVILCQKDIELSLSEEELKRKHEEIVELAEENEKQSEEIRFLCETNKNLNTELEETKIECKKWETEASAYHFDLQISKAYEVVLENKVLELSSVCETLDNDYGSKSVEMEKMKAKVESMEIDIGFFKAQLSSYTPLINSVRESMALLEHQVRGQHGFKLDHNNVPKDAAEPQNHLEEHISAIPNKIQELHDLQMKINLLEKIVTERKRRVATQEITSIELESAFEQENQPKEEIDRNCENVKLRRDNSSPSQEKNESSVDKIEVPTFTSKPNLENNERNIVEIDFNVKQLETLQKTVKDLKMKMHKNKKRKMNTVDLEVMKKQLTEVEQTLVHMADINGSIETSPDLTLLENGSLNLDMKALANREFEKTKSLHLEVQMIQNMFLKLENGNKSRGKTRFLKRTSVVAKSFFRIWRRKGIFRCCRPSSNSYVVGNR